MSLEATTAGEPYISPYNSPLFGDLTGFAP